jgi:hydrogenase expression/formation protein HypD
VPAVARTVQLAAERGLQNLKFLMAHRTLPPALQVLCGDAETRVTGFLLPGHVSAILGHDAYLHVAALKVPAAITGFEPLDILAGVHSVLQMTASSSPAVTNMYSRVVRPEGNPAARALIERVFQPVDAVWRGIGTIPMSGLGLRSEFHGFDATRVFDVPVGGEAMPAGCSCGSVLRGVMRPDECPLFAGACTPDSPVGPCMVSSEGSCAAYYRYERDCP